MSEVDEVPARTAGPTPRPDRLPPAERAAAVLTGALADAGGPAALDTAVVLGSGWRGAADLVGETVLDVDASAVPGFRAPAVAGHQGRLRISRTPDGAHVLVIGARTHLYEGHGAGAVAHGVRTAAAAGCRSVVLTNGCGSLVPGWPPGTCVLLSDHVNLTGTTPLAGPRFVDMSAAYSPRLRALAREVDPGLPEGVYAQFPGPQYETPAEVRMARVLGADLVGMSTALETVAARAEGLEVLGISLVTNAAAGTGAGTLDHAEVLAAGRDAAERCARLLAGVVHRITAAPADRDAAREAPADATRAG